MAGKGLFSIFLGFYFNAGMTYRSLKKDEEKRDKSVKLGVRSIIFTVVGFVFTALCLWGFIACYKNIGSSGLGAIVFIVLDVALAVAAITAFAEGMISGLVNCIYQLRLNKKAVGIVSLVVWLVCLAGAVAVVLLLLL